MSDSISTQSAPRNEVMHRPTHKKIGLILGPLACSLLMLMPAPESLNPVAWSAAAVGIWMAIWWSTEAVHVAVTALLPLVLFPQLGILDIKSASAPYANPTIYLCLLYTSDAADE